MQIAVLGVKGDLDVRERALKALLKTCEILSQNIPIVVLTTCHRFEIYFSSFKDTHTLKFFLSLIKQNNLEKHSYLFSKKKCFVHLCKTAAGLDSAFIGESEIQRQVKKAYQTGKNLPFSLHYLFQKSLMISKEIRTQFFTKQSLFKLEKTLLDKILKQVSHPKVLFVGNSEMNRKILSHFQRFPNVHSSMCSRFSSQACIENWKLLDRWVEFDAIICASKQKEFCIHPAKTTKPVSIFDLSVPRCVDPKVGEDANVYLKNIDEIYQGIDSKKHVFEKSCTLFIETKVNKLVEIYEKKEKYKSELQKAAC